MAFGDFDLTSSKARFEALSDLDKAGQWVAFIDALDAGGAGFHSHYLHLASLYEEGETPFQTEALEPRQVQLGEIAYDLYSEEFGTPPF